jgi:chemotaxis protein methyltransferase CheR
METRPDIGPSDARRYDTIPRTPVLSDRDFGLFQDLIRRESGIYLTSEKKALLVARLARRLRELGLNSMGAYYRYVVEEGEEERTRLLNCISTNETSFFREAQHFEFLEQKVFPIWLKQWESGVREQIRVWSAACSTGEEAYSLAMMLCDYFPPHPGRSINILATDISTRALEIARAGVWPSARSTEIPGVYLKRFMLRGTGLQEGKMKAGQVIRSVIRFHRVNLSDNAYPATGPFDLILCRNVLIYFDRESKARAIDRLLDCLAPDGYFLLGHAEGIHGLTDRVRNIAPAVYARLRPLARRAEQRGGGNSPSGSRFPAQAGMGIN